MQTKINWFEIPSADFSRAVRFYEALFGSKLKIDDCSERPMAVFTAGDRDGVGCVVHDRQVVPSTDGPVLYLDAGASLDAVLARVEPAGGRVVMQKLKLPDELGYIAQFIDTEGNKLALHAQP